MNVKRIGALSLVASLLLASIVLAAPPLSGAIFTTTVDGSIVNENVRYEAKEDVYLDGGPGPNAPSTAAGLPAGDYYFQVTDPSGQDLLSTDHISCRMIRVNEFGVIDFVYPGTNYVWQNGQNAGWVEEACQHAQGVDVDHSELGAITVQLFPYDDTPNPGGVYKAWVTRVEDYAGDSEYVPVDKKDAVNGENYQPANFHGFIPAKSKTDNYKVRQPGRPYIPPEITVLKFHDKNLNGVQDAGEEDVIGWEVVLTDPTGVDSFLYTPETVLAAEAGAYIFEESTPAGTLQTVSILDGVIESSFPSADPIVTVNVAGDSEETHTVIYGNVGLGEIEACKIYDRNGNGEADEGEPGIEGWKMQLDGTDVTGATVGPIVQMTGADGCTTFSSLLPGTYTVSELMPANGGWIATGATSQPFTIVSTLEGAVMSGGSYNATFTNYCVGYADFGTKGYWHNKNGLIELTNSADGNGNGVPDIIDYVNTLAPYASASPYFGAGDEPFDGVFDDGTDVEAALGDGEFQGAQVAVAGSWQAEVSLFLVDQNAGSSEYYHKEQLAQQLLAFIFNSYFRLDDPGATIELPDGSLISASDLIGQAIGIWESGSDAEITAMQELLNALNESDAVPFVHYFPCPVSYD